LAQIASTIPAVVYSAASVIRSMPCRRSAAVVTGPMLTASIVRSSDTGTADRRFSTVEVLVKVTKRGFEARASAARAGRFSGARVR
jgi:hypothetical protein